jgi:hypothetical protein
MNIAFYCDNRMKNLIRSEGPVDIRPGRQAGIALRIG